MTRVDEFNSFYASTFAEAVHVTYAVCGDRQVAFEATVDAYRRAWRDWSKIRDRHPLSYVRNEAWKLTALSRGTHPLRRRHEEDSDTGLLTALHELPADDRRLIALMTLGNTDLEEASREVGVPAEVGIENVTSALTALEKALDDSIDAVERRMHGLSAVTDTLEAPRSADIRTAARRGRQRNTVLLVVVALVVIFGGGWLATDGDALATSEQLPQRQKIGAESQDILLDAEKIDSGNLLSAAQVTQLGTDRTWKVENTDDDLTNTTPYATCPTTRFADKDPLKVFVRTFSASGTDNARVAQAIELSRSEEVATETYQRLVQWYADCEHPRVELVAAYTVQRPFGDFQILKLRSHRSPERTFTVGFSHSGTVTSTLVHEVDGVRGPSVQAFARTLNDSVAKICKDSGGDCSDEIEVVRSDPPPTSKAPSFLGIVDLPPVADIDKVWAAAPFAARTNPAATLCDNASFTSKSVEKAGSRIYVLYQAENLPKEFGIAETVARFTSVAKAKTFVKLVNQRIADCSDDILSAKVDQNIKISEPAFSGQARRVSFQLLRQEQQPGLPAHRDRAPRHRRRPGDVHARRQVRHHPEAVRRHRGARGSPPQVRQLTPTPSPRVVRFGRSGTVCLSTAHRSGSCLHHSQGRQQRAPTPS
ncbi:RNA polymerase sigma factor [Aeromicrobium sp. UC242_57]|uniref:RNA polymerase sigma factor n=1 Tax=Aeromicrobium sp. UC242_57 TaxID=3374624 RepID=UPI00379D2DB0